MFERQSKPTDPHSSDPNEGLVDRARWIAITDRIARPVLTAAAERRLRATMPLEISPGGVPKTREPIGRLLCGMAPWLDLPAHVGDTEEQALRAEFVRLAQEAIRGGVDPQSPDLFVTAPGRPEPVVDAAHLCLAILRAPRVLWEDLAADDKNQITTFLRKTRKFMPHYNNWLLFSAIVEAFLLFAGEDDWDALRVDYALRQHEQWYLGDGIYGDGDHLRMDYYNSLVMHPFMVDIIRTVKFQSQEWEALEPDILARASRYAAIQERMISPEGTYPPIGRSLAYRFGAFHLLGQAAHMGFLPNSLRPGQVRAAMSAVLVRQMEAPGTFDSEGWLTVGFAGHQNSLGDRYIVTGSLYLCSAGLLPLGLHPKDPFWADPAQPWSSVLAWSGQDLDKDRPLELGPLDKIPPAEGAV